MRVNAITHFVKSIYDFRLRRIDLAITYQRCQYKFEFIIVMYPNLQR